MAGMRRVLAVLALGSSASSSAGELDLHLGVQGTTTAWDGDHGGGAALDVGYWFLPWFGASFIGKEQYATIDDRFLSYFSVNAAARHTFGPLRLTGTLGVVHQHEEPRAAVMSQPLQALFGVGDGIRHRMAARTGVSLAWPFAQYDHGDLYVALDVDGTLFADDDRGPRWMTNAGLSLGFTYDFARSK